MTSIEPIGEEPKQFSIYQFKEALQDAKEKAIELATIVEECKLYATISGHKYLTVEAWETIGVAYGMTAKVEWTRELEHGWEARAVVLDFTGVERSAAECEAGRDDDKPWNSRPSYQQRSMAQTRAISKALRLCLSWVVVLAGYSPTPAEEMPHSASSDERIVTQPQRNRLFAIMRKENVEEADVLAYILGHFGKEGSATLTFTEYDQLCGWIQGADSATND